MSVPRNVDRLASPWDAAENVLAVRLDTLGDVLMTTPALRALKDSHPGRRITLLTSASGAAAASLGREIDEVLVYEAPWMKTSGASGAAPDLAMIEELRVRGFDAAVIFTVYSQNPLPAALLCYLAGIPLRLAHSHENPYRLLTDWVPDREPARIIRHEVQRQLDLVAAVGCRTDDRRLSVRVPDGAHATTFDRLSHLGIDPLQPWAVIHPGATAPSRRYPPGQFAEVARRLVAQGIEVVFTGTASERELVDEIRRSMQPPSHWDTSRALAGVHSLAGALTLPELGALLEQASLLISNNTGPVHLAAGLGTPVVVVYALTNPQHTPWMTPNRVLAHDVTCKFCYKSICPEGHHNCLRLLSPEDVVTAALDLLAECREARAVRLAPDGAATPLGVREWREGVPA